ncbi:COR domain-containing protein [Massilia sp. W12]|uniref:COR domain-containing protein n=1 Tax=Massilia sp. W12 TaxID=3126507 RepID=UPI0030D0DDA7
MLRAHIAAEFRAKNAAYTDAAAAYAYADAAADAAAYAYAASAAYAYAAAAAAYADSAAAAYVATAYAATAAAEAQSTIPELKEIFLFDLNLLKTSSTELLLAQPLWRQQTPHSSSAANDTPPPIWLDLRAAFRQQLEALHPSFLIWYELWNDCVEGRFQASDEYLSWLKCPPEIESQGAIAINEYLAGLRNKSLSKPLNRVRAIVLGDGNAGKTSLVRALHGLAMQENEKMTPGIAISEWPGAGQNLTTHIWDFGGQVIAHATHQFFLRASCLYVLVMCARAETNANEQAEYWLQHVKAYGSNEQGEAAPVLLVANKCELTELKLDYDSLCRKYPNIIGYYPLSCAQALTGERKHKFDEFKQRLIKELHGLNNNQVMFSPAHFQVLQAVRQLASQKSFLANKEFTTLCADNKVQQEGLNRDWLLDVLDRLGVILHIGNITCDDDFILNPRWLTYGVYTVMYQEQANIDLQSVRHLLSATPQVDELGQTLDYPAAKCQVILDAMLHFKLCYVQPGQPGKYIIPGLLPTSAPKKLGSFLKQQGTQRAFRLRFAEFLPRHVLPEFIVMRHKQIVRDLVWQYGVALQDQSGQTLALLESDYQRREIAITLFGRDVRDFLAAILADLSAILQRLPQLEWEQELQLPEEARAAGFALPHHKPEWANYLQIQETMREGQASYISAKGVKYDLRKVFAIFGQSKTGSMEFHQHFHAGSHVEILGEKNMGSTVNITGNNTIHGNVAAAETISHSFNQGSAGYDEVMKKLAELQQQFAAWQASMPEHAQKAEDCQTDVQEAIAELQSAQPNLPKVKKYMRNIMNAVGLVSGFSSAVEAVKFVVELLSKNED